MLRTGFDESTDPLFRSKTAFDVELKWLDKLMLMYGNIHGNNETDYPI